MPPNFSSSYVSTEMVISCSSMSFSAFSSNFFNSGIVYSLLTFALFLILRARYPNLSVLNVSCSLKGCGEHVMTRHVFEFPPRDSDKILVNFDSRYGIWWTFLSVSALMTLPSVVKLLLIILASSRVYPAAPVFEIFSEPAKSTRYSRPTLHDRS